MAVNLVSPGVNIREVDLTTGGVRISNSQGGGIAGPFERGPIEEPILITSESALVNTFGKPQKTGDQSEYWLTASSYLSYGGALRVVRADGEGLQNAVAGTATTVKIKNFTEYESSTPTNWYFASKDPGSWANGLKVCVIDAFADQTIAISTSNPSALGAIVGNGVTVSISNEVIPGITTSLFNGYLKGVITGVSTTASISTISVKIISRVSSGNTETAIEYIENNRANSIKSSDTLSFLNTSGVSTGATIAAGTVSDWYSQQTLGLTNSTVYWKSIASKPGTSEYASARNSKNDEMHIVVVDDTGSVSGISGNILEKFVSLSKAIDGRVTPSQSYYYKDVIATRSQYIYVGVAETGVKSVISSTASPWGVNAQDQKFDVIGSKVYSLINGKDYNGAVGNYSASISNVISAYNKFKDVEEGQLDLIIGGPSGSAVLYESQSKASAILAIASERKDCIACISAHKNSVIGQTSSELQTSNIIEFFRPLQSTSYGVFDSGYKYMYDRFNEKFEWVNCSGDVAGLMARTFFNNYPWFSPAGTSRGVINNSAKLAYNPNQSQRDRLYVENINPIIVSPGAGTILFGDKTAFRQTSAFDRINVRRLFLTIEKAIQSAARAQLFEFNDIITRTNFINIVEPYLRDVQAKRGITEFLLVCDESNNTPDVIDANQFKADIYIKPARSINFIGLTFVATRSGISFEEIVGSV